MSRKMGFLVLVLLLTFFVAPVFAADTPAGAAPPAAPPAAVPPVPPPPPLAVPPPPVPVVPLPPPVTPAVEPAKAGPAGGMPPGSEGWDETKKKEWTAQMDEVRAKIRAHIEAVSKEEKPVKDARIQRAVKAIDDAGARGVPPGILKVVVASVVEKMGDDTDIAETVGQMDDKVKDEDPNGLGDLVKAKFGENLRGKALADAIKAELDKRWAAKHGGEKPGEGPKPPDAITPPAGGEKPPEAEKPPEGGKGKGKGGKGKGGKGKGGKGGKGKGGAGGA